MVDELNNISIDGTLYKSTFGVIQTYRRICCLKCSSAGGSYVVCAALEYIRRHPDVSPYLLFEVFFGRGFVRSLCCTCCPHVYDALLDHGGWVVQDQR